MKAHDTMCYRKTFLSVVWAAILLNLSFSSAFADSGGCPGEEMHRSSSGQYYLHLLPIGSCYAAGYRLQWTYGKTAGQIYFQRNARYPSNVAIANDGERIITVGNYVHNMIDDIEEGIWFYKKNGDVIRHIPPPAICPTYRTVSSRWWFSRSYISSTLGIYMLTTTDGVRRIYGLSKGNLVFVLPALWHVLLLGTIWMYVMALRRGFPRLIEYFRMMRQRILEKQFGREAKRQARLFLVKLTYSLLTAVLAALFLAIGSFVYPILAHLIVGDEGALFDAHIQLLDADIWFEITLIVSIFLLIVHLIVSIVTFSETSFKRSLAVAGSYALIFIFVMVDTAAVFDLIYFFPVTASVFLFWPAQQSRKALGQYVS